MFVVALNTMIVLWVLMAIGYVLSKKGVINDESNKTLSYILLNVALPCTIFLSLQIQFEYNMIYNMVVTLIISCLVMAISYCIGAIICKIFKVSEKNRGVAIGAIIFGNNNFMGFPIIMALFGEESVFYISIFNIPAYICLFTVGIMLVSKGYSESKISVKAIFSPAVNSIIIGIIFCLFRIPVPATANKILVMLSGLSTPLSLIVIGVFLSKVPVKEVVKLQTYEWCVVVSRLLVLPIVSLGLAQLFNINTSALQAIVTIGAVPTATLLPIITTNANGNVALASKFVFVTTVLSLITIPLVVGVLI